MKPFKVFSGLMTGMRQQWIGTGVTAIKVLSVGHGVARCISAYEVLDIFGGELRWRIGEIGPYLVRANERHDTFGTDNVEAGDVFISGTRDKVTTDAPAPTVESVKAAFASAKF